MIVRTHPRSPCQPDGAHHPHLYECDDDLCCPSWEDVWPMLWCCVCRGDWPCKTKQAHVAARHAETDNA